MLRSISKGIIVCSDDLDVEEVAKYLHVKEGVPVIFKRNKKVESTGLSDTDVVLADSWQFYVTNVSNVSKLPKGICNADNKVTIFVGYKNTLNKAKRRKLLFSLLDAIVEGNEKEDVLENMREILFLMGACA